MIRRFRGVALAAVLLVAVVACRSSAPVRRALEANRAACVPVETASPAASRVDLYLAEWAIDAKGALQEGTVQLRTHNDTDRTHRLALVRRGAGLDFVTKADGTLDVDKLSDKAWVSEIAAGTKGQSCTTTVDITPGEYAVFCVIDDPALGVQARHWSNGMVRHFRVHP